ncbi:hypothetical protein LSTR_LSTR017210 [Laodelphax striatellus]|uniref:Uncharacterized protein n=1 Tax=Laodelphax striatellus TaxID=195883 RepID=A0A482WQ92_LAOST|nr:hypothetical protein LSTR_LSTR017210 [Laodelphax striatellus]
MQLNIASRGRYRGGNGSPRTRVRTNGASSTTTTSTESPDDATKRTRFQPSKNRVEGQVSAYGRRGSKKPVTEQNESSSATEEESTPRPTGPRNRSINYGMF